MEQKVKPKRGRESCYCVFVCKTKLHCAGKKLIVREGERKRGDDGKRGVQVVCRVWL